RLLGRRLVCRRRVLRAPDLVEQMRAELPLRRCPGVLSARGDGLKSGENEQRRQENKCHEPYPAPTDARWERTAAGRAAGQTQTRASGEVLLRESGNRS